jgi:hypothetical protein
MDSFFQSAWAGLNAYSSAMARKAAKQITTILKMAAKQLYKGDKIHGGAKHTNHQHTPRSHSAKHTFVHLPETKSISAHSMKDNVHSQFFSDKTVTRQKHSTPHLKSKPINPKTSGIPIKYAFNSKHLKAKPALICAKSTDKGKSHAFIFNLPVPKTHKPKSDSMHMTPSVSGATDGICHFAHKSPSKLIFPKVASEAALPSE